jgi:hypothetical protein
MGTQEFDNIQVNGKSTMHDDVKINATSITLGLNKNGGGQLIIAHSSPDDNNIILEAWNKDFTDSANEVVLMGGNADIPSLSLKVKNTKFNGDVEINATSITLGLNKNGGGQLIIAHSSPDDNNIILEAWNKDFTDSANEVVLMGANKVDIPSLILKAKNTKFNGNINALDVILVGGDCAEEFDVDDKESTDPGTVMVIDDGGSLKPSQQAYDKRVAGVISGAGDLRTGITLGKQKSNYNRLPLALTGKVYCKVDAEYSPIDVGDLLTTSSTIGHAMKVSDPIRSIGTIIGKALKPLEGGRGLIPILVALQ